MEKPDPPDLEQCQALIPSGYSFMTLGGKPGEMLRCSKKPSYIVYELEKQTDGQKGSMSLCVNCKNVFITQCASKLNEYAFAELIDFSEVI